MVLDYPDGRFAIRHNGVDLPCRTFDKRPQVNQGKTEQKRVLTQTVGVGTNLVCPNEALILKLACANEKHVREKNNCGATI
jgi:hypothetical protein